MKRFFPILLLLTALTACPQAGQILGPSNAGVTPAKDGTEDSTSPGSPGSEDTPPPEAAPPPEGTPPPGPPDPRFAGGHPIEPKADAPTVGGEYTDHARMHYGDSFEKLLVDSESGVFDKIPVGATGEIHLPAIAESRKSTNLPWKESEGSYVRMVFYTTDLLAKPQYCDTSVIPGDPAAEGGNVLFTGVSAKEGFLSFLHLNPSNFALQKAQVNHSSDPISLCALGWKPWNNEETMNVNWIYLGSLAISSIQIHQITTPAPNSTTPLFKKP
jgi:hypothetical protein